MAWYKNITYAIKKDFINNKVLLELYYNKLKYYSFKPDFIN